jgi:uncharacterized protein YjbJ (UPF0337 family)
MSTGKTAFALLTGVAAGAILGVLFAPAKGTETRRRLMSIAGDLSDTARDIAEEGIEKIRGGSNLLSLKGNWNEIKGRLKQQFSTLTDLDLTYVDGKEDELIGKLQNKLGKTREEIVSIIRKISQPARASY